MILNPSVVSVVFSIALKKPLFRCASVRRQKDGEKYRKQCAIVQSF